MAAARAAGTTAGRDLSGEIAFLTRALKAPALRESVSRLAERARSESWSHEEYLVACRQAAYRRRHASVAENQPRQHTGGRTRRLNQDQDNRQGVNIQPS